MPTVVQSNRFTGYVMPEHVTAQEGKVDNRWEYINLSTFYPDAPLVVAECGRCRVVRITGCMGQAYQIWNEYTRSYSSCRSLHEAVGLMKTWTEVAVCSQGLV
jgi:hypothetical protein